MELADKVVGCFRFLRSFYFTCHFTFTLCAPPSGIGGVFVMSRGFFFGLLVVVFLTAHRAYAQKLPHFNHYYYLSSFYNPALIANNKLGEFSVIGRTQWVGYQPTFDSNSGAPITQQANLTLPLGKWPVAVGLAFTNDQVGPLFSRIAQFSSAYRLALSQASTLSFGVTTYYIMRGVDYQLYRFSDDADPLNTNNWENDANVDFAAGVGYAFNSFFIAFAMRNLADVNYDYGFGTYVDESRTLSTSVFQTGYVFILSGTSTTPNLSIAPNLLLQSDLQNHYFVDFGGIVEVQRRLRMGLNMRHLEAAGVVLGFNFLKSRSLRLGYASDFTLNNPGAKAFTSHEVMLNYQFSVRRLERIPIQNPRFDY